MSIFSYNCSHLKYNRNEIGTFKTLLSHVTAIVPPWRRNKVTVLSLGEAHNADDNYCFLCKCSLEKFVRLSGPSASDINQRMWRYVSAEVAFGPATYNCAFHCSGPSH